jgi:hypothetical protein
MGDIEAMLKYLASAIRAAECASMRGSLVEIGEDQGRGGLEKRLRGRETDASGFAHHDRNGPPQVLIRHPTILPPFRPDIATALISGRRRRASAVLIVVKHHDRTADGRFRFFTPGKCPVV